jgi:ribosomal protein L21E
MTDTESMIRQALRELHIEIEPNNRKVTITNDFDGCTVKFQNRKGNDTETKVQAEQDYKTVYELLRSAWRG